MANEQSLRRLYFTDPVICLYMMREFNVKFEWENSISRSSKDHTLINLTVDSICRIILEHDLTLSRFYVCKESEKIFLPILNDLEKDGLHFDGFCWTEGKHCMLAPESCATTRRNDKPFFVAEIEELIDVKAESSCL